MGTPPPPQVPPVVGDGPAVHTPEADVPLTPIEGVTDERVLSIADAGAKFQQLIRDTLAPGPHVELAARYVDLAVQAAHGAAQETPPVATGEPGSTPQDRRAPGRSASPQETPSLAARTRKQE